MRLALVLGFLATSALSFAEGVVLRYKLEPNTPVFHLMRFKSSTVFASPDSPERNLQIETWVTMRQELIEEKNDVIKLALTMINASQKVDGVEQPLPGATNQTQIVEMKPNGEILRTLASTMQAQEQSPLQMVFPDEAVEAGKTWTRIRDIAEPIPVETKTLYKITELGPKRTTISSIMKLENRQGDTITATTRGSTVFDHTKGKILSSAADSEFQFEIPMKVPGILPNSSSVKVTMKMEISTQEITEPEAQRTDFFSKQ